MKSIVPLWLSLIYFAAAPSAATQVTVAGAPDVAALRFAADEIRAAAGHTSGAAPLAVSLRMNAAACTRQYRQPLLYNRVGLVDLPKLADKAAADIELARNGEPVSIAPKPRRGGSGSKFGP
jgi:hypothetical protein